MFYTVLKLHKHPHHPALIEMLAYANNVSLKKMTDSYCAIDNMLKHIQNQKQR